MVVDEAYLPFLPDEAERTLVPAVVDRDNLVVLRSMTKIYAIPGLRIGYAVAAPEMIARLRRNQQPWTVTTAAEVAALASLDDDEYLGRTIELIQAEAARLTDRLWDVPGLRPAWPDRDRPGVGPVAAELRPRQPGRHALDLDPGSRTPWPAAASWSASAPTIAGLEPGSVVTAPGLAIETRGHLRFCVRTPDENDLLLATLTALMSTDPEP